MLTTRRGRAPTLGCAACAAVLSITPAWAADEGAADAPTEIPRRVYETRRTETPPRLDGHLDDAAWNLVEWSSDFVQWDPDEGKPPTEQTAFTSFALSRLTQER